MVSCETVVCSALKIPKVTNPSNILFRRSPQSNKNSAPPGTCRMAHRPCNIRFNLSR